MSKCEVCGREVVEKSEYCERHMTAYENVTHKYNEWKRAQGTEWKEYLNEIVASPLTGAWAKKVAQQLITENETHPEHPH